MLERLDFTQEGIIRNYEYLNGEYHDRVIYGKGGMESNGYLIQFLLS
ncbi:hypothetical protein ACTWPF_04355 [Oceanobacillus sp. M65]